jgi:hypothetical protein
VALPTQAHAQNRQHTAQLTCGRATLTAETRWQTPPDTSLVWLAQKLSIKLSNRMQTPVPLESHQGQHVVGHSGLDAVVLSWACIRSTSGASYILLSYGCGSDDAEKLCGGENEWFRLLNEKGERVDSDFARQDKRYEQLYKKLGLAKLMSSGVSMTSLVSSD